MVYYASFNPSFMVAREQLSLVDEERPLVRLTVNRPPVDQPPVDRPPMDQSAVNRPPVDRPNVAPQSEGPSFGPTPNSGPPTRPGPTDTATDAPTDAAMVSPLDDVEALEALEERITTLAARIHAATHRLLVLIADFDRRQGWQLGGHRSCAHWLAFRTGIDLGTAREKVRTARVLVGLPETSASMSRGELSFSQVRAVTRVATPENERKLLKAAHNSTTAQLERKVRAFKRGSREDEAALERRRFESRSLSVFSDHEGMYVVRGRLTAEVGALLMRAVEAASDTLYREERGPETKSDMGSGSSSNPAMKTASNAASRTASEVEPQKAAAQRRADALGLLLEQALAAGFGGNAESRAPICGTRAERYQVMLHVDAETLRSEGEEDRSELEGSRSELEDGTRVSAETSQRLSCDAGLVRVHHSEDGSILDVGRRTRTIPPALRRALEVRDGGCRFPGCGSRFTEGHHVKHWAEGGETSKDNCLLVCRHHHRLLHEGGWKVEWRDGEGLGVEWRNGEDPGGRTGVGAGGCGGKGGSCGGKGGGYGGEPRGGSGGGKVGGGKCKSGGARKYPVFIDRRGGLHSDGGG